MPLIVMAVCRRAGRCPRGGSPPPAAPRPGTGSRPRRRSSCSRCRPSRAAPCRRRHRDRADGDRRVVAAPGRPHVVVVRNAVVVVRPIVGAAVAVVGVAMVVVGPGAVGEARRVDRPAVAPARDHGPVAVAAALDVGHDAAAVGTARAVALGLDLLPVTVRALALELPAVAGALGLALPAGGLAGPARRRDVARHRVDVPVVHLVGLRGALAGAALRLDVAVHRHVVARLADVAGGGRRLPAPGRGRGRAARACCPTSCGSSCRSCARFDQLPPVPDALRLTLLTDPRDALPPPRARCA